MKIGDKYKLSIPVSFLKKKDVEVTIDSLPELEPDIVGVSYIAEFEDEYPECIYAFRYVLKSQLKPITKTR